MLNHKIEQRQRQSDEQPTFASVRESPIRHSTAWTVDATRFDRLI